MSVEKLWEAIEAAENEGLTEELHAARLVLANLEDPEPGPTGDDLTCDLIAKRLEALAKHARRFARAARVGAKRVTAADWDRMGRDYASLRREGDVLGDEDQRAVSDAVRARRGRAGKGRKRRGGPRGALAASILRLTR